SLGGYAGSDAAGSSGRGAAPSRINSTRRLTAHSAPRKAPPVSLPPSLPWHDNLPHSTGASGNSLWNKSSKPSGTLARPDGCGMASEGQVLRVALDGKKATEWVVQCVDRGLQCHDGLAPGAGRRDHVCRRDGRETEGQAGRRGGPARRGAARPRRPRG